MKVRTPQPTPAAAAPASPPRRLYVTGIGSKPGIAPARESPWDKEWKVLEGSPRTVF